jgi:hypothetical protein
MISTILGVLALLSFAVAIVAFTVYQNPAVHRRRGGGTPGERSGGKLPDPFAEREVAKDALAAAVIALATAVVLAFLAYELR